MSSDTPRVSAPAAVRVIASPRNWIEGSAVQQLERTAALPGMIAAVGMPDLHPGKGSPVGAAFLARDFVYPFLVGNDIGCGVGLWRTDLPHKVKREAWAGKLRELEGAWDGEAEAWLAKFDAEPSGFEESLGTIGGGNHFAEIQQVESVASEELAQGLTKGSICLLVHSGSRGFGERILRNHTERFGAGGLAIGGGDAAAYLRGHASAAVWARANRALIAHRVLTRLGCKGEPLLDVCHNSVTETECGWLHRKGAAPADRGLVVIPGSRGTFSYLAAPVQPRMDSLFSLAHGAGRKWARGDSRGRLEKRFPASRLERTELGGIVICEDRSLLYEEAPQAYKDIDIVIQDMVEAGLLQVVATLRPVVTYKVRR